MSEDSKIDFNAATNNFFVRMNTNLLVAEVAVFLTEINKRIDRTPFSSFAGRYEELCNFVEEHELASPTSLEQMKSFSKTTIATPRKYFNIDFMSEAKTIVDAAMNDKIGVIKSFFINEIAAFTKVLQLL